MNVRVSRPLFVLVALVLVGSLFPTGATLADDPVPESFPTPRCCMAMTYFPGPNVVILYGGIDSNNTVKSDTWMYNWSTNNWTNLNLTPNPGTRRSVRMVYADSVGKIMLFGGTASTTGYRPRTHHSRGSFLTTAALGHSSGRSALI
jgi:hypothetical protein